MIKLTDLFNKRERMKIRFFKNENDFYKRTSYCWENAELAVPKIKNNINCVILIAISFILFGYVLVFRNKLSTNLCLFAAIAILLLPVHELCHALFCFLTKRKIERICFFSSFSINEPTAYVMPEFTCWSKTERVLFYLFPTIMLSLIPTIIAIILPSVRFWLLLVSLYNLLCSAFDVSDSIKIISLPVKSVVFEGFALLSNRNQAIVIHKISLLKVNSEIKHEQFVYEHRKLTKIDNPIETEKVKQLKSEFL